MCRVFSSLFTLVVLTLLAAPVSAQPADANEPEVTPEETYRAQLGRRLRLRFVGDLRLRSSDVLRRQRENNEPQVIISAILTGVGAAALVTGIGMSLTTCRAGGIFDLCEGFDVGFVAVGGLLAGLGGLSLIAGAAWLGVADRLRRRLDAALELTSVSVAPTERGALLSLEGVF